MPPSPFRFDVFVSFATADRDWAEGVLIPALSASQVRCATTSDFPAGMPLLSVLAAAVEEAEHIVLVLSPAYLTDHDQQVVGLLGQHVGTERRTWPVIPILLQPAELPLTLRMLNPVDATSKDQWLPALQRLCRQLDRPLAPDVPLPCPYPGILPYSRDFGPLFFGRQWEIDEAVQRLRLNPCLFVIGSSGCGKSSLVHAGIVPRMVADGFEPILLRPGADPLAAEEAAAAQLTVAFASGRRPLLVVDQLEDIFAGQESGVDRSTPFITRMLTLLEDGAVTMVATARADFYPQLMSTALWPTIRDHRLELVPLSGPELRSAISEPAAALGVLLETSLADELATATDSQPGSLPFLQEALVLIWPKRQYRLLPLSAYTSLAGRPDKDGLAPRSGLEVAMALRADSVIAALPNGQARVIAKRILLRLVQFGAGRDDVRQQQSQDALRSVDDDPAVFDATIDHLVNGHLLTVTASSSNGPAVLVDLSHEALIRGWPELRTSIEQRRASESRRRELEAAASAWGRRGGAEGGLLDEVELGEAQRWRRSEEASELGVSDLVDQLLSASAAALNRSRRRRVRMSRGLQALSLGLAVCLVAATALGLTARAQRDRAVVERATAQSGELALTATSLPLTQLDRSLLLAQEAVQLRRTPRSLGSVLSTLQADRRLTRIVPFEAAISALSASADHRSVAVGLVNGQVRLTDVATGRSTVPAMSVDGQVHSVAFSPDGTLVAAASSRGVVQQFRTADGSPYGPPLAGHNGSVRTVAYSPDGRWLATGGVDHRVILHPRGSGDGRLRVLRGHRDWVNAAVFTSDSRYLITAGGGSEQRSTDGRTLVWEVSSGRLVQILPDQGDAVRGVAVTPNGTIATASADGRVRTWRLKGGSGGAVIARHRDRAYGVAFVQNGQQVASASRDGQVLLSGLPGARNGSPLLGHGAAVRAVVGLGDDRLATAGDDARLIIWTIGAPPRLARPLNAPARPVRAVAVSPDGTRFATGNDDGVVTLRDAADAQAVQREIRTGPQPVWGIAFGPGDLLVTTSSTGVVQVWDARTGRLRSPPVRTAAPATVVAVSGDGTQIATAGQDDVVRIWDPELHPLGASGSEHVKPVVALSFLADGDLVSAGFDGTLWRWQRPGGGDGALSGRRLAASTSAFTSLSVAPDGQTAVTGDVDGDLISWDLTADDASRTDRPVLVGHSAVVSVVQHTVDGLLLSADEAGVVRIWDLASGGRTIGELGRGAPARAGGLLTRQGTFLVGTDVGLTAWVVDEARWSDLACAVAGRNLRPAEQRDYLGRTTYRATCPGLPPPAEAAPAPPTDNP